MLFGRNPSRWRVDPVGNVVCNKLTTCEGCLCHEYDHIVPFSKGGLTSIENCQILQTRVNRFKGSEANDVSKLKGYSCNYTFSGNAFMHCVFKDGDDCEFCMDSL
jgi:HNH endonuclease